MKRLLFVACSAASLAGVASADEREDAIKTIARVLAFQKLCPRIEIDMSGPVLPLMSSYDFDHDQREVLTEVQRQAAPWSGKSEEAICATALTLYGPNGSNTPDLLKVKYQLQLLAPETAAPPPWRKGRRRPFAVSSAGREIR